MLRFSPFTIDQQYIQWRKPSPAYLFFVKSVQQYFHFFGKKVPNTVFLEFGLVSIQPFQQYIQWRKPSPAYLTSALQFSNKEKRNIFVKSVQLYFHFFREKKSLIPCFQSSVWSQMIGRFRNSIWVFTIFFLNFVFFILCTFG